MASQDKMQRRFTKQLIPSVASTYRQHIHLTRKPRFLELLPGEIRNQIYDFYIQDALNSAKAKARRKREAQSRGIWRSGYYDPPPPKPREFEVSVLPRWHGPSVLRLEGFPPLPLLFVNKLIYNELSGLIYSRVDKVTIGGLILQYRSEDPNVRWRSAYALLKKKPDVLKFAKNITIKLPSTHDDILNPPWIPIGGASQRRPSRPAQDDGTCFKVIPGLEEFLHNFESLTKLEIIIQVHPREPPDFTPLFRLFNITHRMKVRFSGSSRELNSFPHWPTQWNQAWTASLKKKETSDLEAALLVSTLSNEIVSDQ